MKVQMKTKSDLLFMLATSIKNGVINQRDLTYMLNNFEHEYGIQIQLNVKDIRFKFATKGFYREVWDVDETMKRS